MNKNILTMRDTFIDELVALMAKNESIFFLTADFGAPSLDKLRELYPKRFINVGIAEQNLINITAGLALEGFKVIAYAIAPFLTMRCFEQIRVNLAILSQIRTMRVTLVGVGAGFSYEMTGPTHQCIEDISIMSTLPNVKVFSPSDSDQVKLYADEVLKEGIRYARFDAKPLKPLESQNNLKKGFRELRTGEKVCLLSTGYMSHLALKCADSMNESEQRVGAIDCFYPNHLDVAALLPIIGNYKTIITLEEGLIGCGGLDSKIAHILFRNQMNSKRFISVGASNKYSFVVGSREVLHKQYAMDEASIMEILIRENA